MDTKDDKTKGQKEEDFIAEFERQFDEPKRPKINHGPSRTTSETRKFTSEEIEQIQLQSKIKDKKYYLNPSTWIYLFNELHQIKFIYKTDSILKKGQKLDAKTYRAFMRVSIKEMGLAKYMNKQVVDDVITLWMSAEKTRFLSETRIGMAFQESSTDLFRVWVRAATGKDNKLDAAVMKHFVWQVRRKLFGLQAYQHIMPILYGKTGGGKSRAVVSLLKPMDDLSLNMDLSIFSDQFRTRLFSKAFIMFFDEMAKSERADIDKLKNIITADCVDFRGMHTEDLESTPQNCTFIGCSNDLVYDKIYDPSSARRYWQINCADKLDWQVINSIDYLAMWRSVDETKESPIIPFLNEIKDIQEKTIRNKDLIEEWLTTECQPTTYDAKKSPTSQQLYHHFSDWCKIQRINNQPTAAKFFRRLEAVVHHNNLPIGPHRNNRGTVWAVDVGSATATLKLSTLEEQKQIVEELELHQSLNAKVDNLAAKIEKIQK